MLNYKTDFGNEVEPYLICLKGDLYNLSINNEERAIALDKFPANATPTYDQRKATPNAQIETAAFFPLLKEREFIVVSNHKLDMKPLLFSYEDKYGNHYRQSFSFDETEIGREDRLKRINRSCYKLTRRKYKVFWIWLPLIARHV